MPAPGAGQLTREIKIQRRTTTKDSEGGMVDNWVDAFPNISIWAKVNNLSGNERAATNKGGRTLDARVEFTIYYLEGVTNEMRVLHNNRHHNITHVNNFMEENTHLIITTDLGGNHGR